MLRIRSIERGDDAFFHFADSFGDSDEDGSADDAVTDVQFHHTWESGDGADVAVVEAMTGVEFDAGGDGGGGGDAESLDLAVAVGSFAGVGVSAGVEFDAGDSEGDRGVDLVVIGVDEESDFDAGVMAGGDGVLDAGAMGDDVESSLGGQFLATFGHEGDLIGSGLDCEGEDGGFGGEFEVEANLDGFSEEAEVTILNVATVFAEMNGDAVGSREFGEGRGPDRVGLGAATGLAESGDVIDIDTEAGHGDGTFRVAWRSILQWIFCLRLAFVRESWITDPGHGFWFVAVLCEVVRGQRPRLQS